MVRSDSVVVLTLLKSSSWSSHTQKNMKTEKKKTNKKQENTNPIIENFAQLISKGTGQADRLSVWRVR